MVDGKDFMGWLLLPLPYLYAAGRRSMATQLLIILVVPVGVSKSRTARSIRPAPGGRPLASLTDPTGRREVDPVQSATMPNGRLIDGLGRFVFVGVGEERSGAYSVGVLLGSAVSSSST